MATMRPTNRQEKLLAKIAGENYEVEPRNAEEYWLNRIAESGGGGGGGGGLFVANWDTNTGALDKTAGELIEAHENGKHLVVSPSLGEGVEGFAHIDVFEVQHTTYMSGDEEINYYGFAIYATNVSQVVRFEASSADDYPLN